MKRRPMTEQELRDWVIQQVRHHPDCGDFSAEFTVLRRAPLTPFDPTWDVQTVRTEQGNPVCLGRFQRAVEDARRRFDLAVV